MNIIISPTFIKSYLLDKFESNHRFSSGSKELTVPSIFVENDWKRHMSINLDSGLWQCFKSGERGNFFKLYSILEGIKYKDAVLRVSLNGGYFSDQVEVKEEESPDLNVDLFKDSVVKPITNHSCYSEDKLVQDAWVYAFSRRILNSTLPPDETQYFVGIGGYLKDRLIIPYYHGDHLFYYQARTLINDPRKYLNPPYDPEKGFKVRREHVLYPFGKPLPLFLHNFLFVCEGALDAISLQLRGFNATAIASNLPTVEQFSLLKSCGKTLIVSLDGDIAGLRGLKKFEEYRRLFRMPPIKHLKLPHGVKDINEMLCKDLLHETSLDLYPVDDFYLEYLEKFKESIHQSKNQIADLNTLGPSKYTSLPSDNVL